MDDSDMDPPIESECKSLDKDLPSSKFDEDFTSYVDLYSLEDVSLDKEDKTYFSKWYTSFSEKFSHYYKEKAKEKNENISPKRCRNLNYHINYLIFQIYQKELDYKNEEDQKLFKSSIESLKKNIKSLFAVSEKINCERDEKDYTSSMNIVKKLDDYCENRDHLRSVIKDKKEKCQDLIDYVNKKYDCFFNNDSCIIDIDAEEKKTFAISDDCTLYNIPKTFSYFECNNYELPYRIQSIPHCPSQYASIFDQIVAPLKYYIEDVPYLNEILNYPKYACLAVFGIVLIPPILCKFSPLRQLRYRKKRKSSRRKNIDSDVNDVLFSYAGYEPQLTENETYHIAYPNV